MPPMRATAPAADSARAWSGETRATWRAAGELLDLGLEADSTQLRGTGPIFDAGCGGGRLLGRVL